MTPEPDSVSRHIRRSAGGPLGFAENSDDEVEPGEVRQVAVVIGRKGKVETPEGQKNVRGKARLVVAPRGLVPVAGGEGAPIDVDTANQLLDTEDKNKLAGALRKDRKRKKEKLQSKKN